MLQVVDALCCAHARGVVHRDLKPQNIMVTRTEAGLEARVLDFGLSALEVEAGEEMTPISSTQEVLGTPAYAAPEQLRGEPPTSRADLYAWGLILLECLTGRRAMGGRTLQEVLYKQLGPEPVPLPEGLRPPGVERLLRQVLEKEVARRSVSAPKLLEELVGLRAEPVAEAASGQQ